KESLTRRGGASKAGLGKVRPQGPARRASTLAPWAMRRSSTLAPWEARRAKHTGTMAA
ncbi:hypothetical protein HAX54_008907, partial [Datura stramonium]|nr:hypothetical protein [Datura stramonium]